MQGMKEYLPQSGSEFAQKLFDLTPAIVLLIDKKTGLAAANTLFSEMLPFDTIEAFNAKHKDICELFIPSAQTYSPPDPLTCLFDLSRSQKKDESVKLLGKDAQEHLYMLKVEEVAAEGKEFYIVQLDDISAIEKARRAEHYFEEFKQKFLTSISHEFRTPMNGIIGFTELLERTEINSTQKEYLDFISRSAETMMSNVENLLELAQVESGQIALHEYEINLLLTMESFSHTFTDAAKEKQIDLFFYIDPCLPRKITADADKIKKVLKNLIKNAIKYTHEKGQVYVEIRAGRAENNAIPVEYSVTDKGIGIDRQRLSTIIRSFASAKENQSRGKDGLGVGLSLCYKLIKMMHSKLKVATELKKGSRFSFTLLHKTDNEPMFECVKGSRMAIWAEDYYTILYSKLLKEYLEHFDLEVVEIEGLASKELKNCSAVFIVTDYLSLSRIKSIRSQYHALQIIPVINPFNEEKFETVLDEVDGVIMKPLLPNKIYEILNTVWKKGPSELSKRGKSSADFRVLVAEDNPINLKFIETLLSQYGLVVSTALDGKEAVERYEKEKGFDLVFMDIDMPVMDGITATRRIKEIEKNSGMKQTPVIALTAHGLSGDRERILEAGLDDYFAKPFERAKLKLVLRQYLDLEIN
jgi:signal transduction histidine kinase/CheY-like chemotaxis protein